MSNSHGAGKVPHIVPSASSEHAIELGHIPTTSDNHSIGSSMSPSPGKCNSITSRFRKIVKIIDCLKVEKRGIERISSEDRTDLTILNTAMIWVRSPLF